MTWMDHGLVLAFAAVWPAWGYLGYQRYKERVRAGIPGARLAAYAEGMIEQWLLVAAVTALWIHRDRDWAWIGLAAPDSSGGALALAAAALVGALLILQSASVARRPETHERVREALHAIVETVPVQRSDLTGFLALSITAGVCEEILFRGMLGWYLAGYLGAWGAQAAALVLFAAAHLFLGARRSTPRSPGRRRVRRRSTCGPARSSHPSSCTRWSTSPRDGWRTRCCASGASGRPQRRSLQRIARSWQEELVALVVLLRGVNVGGHRTFRPTTLAEQLKHLDAVNIGAAGTFVIRRPVTRAQLRAELAPRLPFDAEIMICQGREIVRLMSQNHFSGQPVRPDIVRFVSVLSRRPRSAPSMPMSLPSRGKWLLKILARDNRFVFGLYRRHMKVISYLGTFDRLFGVRPRRATGIPSLRSPRCSSRSG